MENPGVGNMEDKNKRTTGAGVSILRLIQDSKT
jgi:hypothetical protein